MLAWVLGLAALVFFDLFVLEELTGRFRLRACLDVDQLRAQWWALVGGQMTLNPSVWVLAPTAVLAALFVRRARPAEPRRRARATDEVPPRLRSLALQVEDCARRLERGDDRIFDLEATELGLELSSLDASTRASLEERDANYRRLRTILSGLEPRRRMGAKLRRSLHAELLRFVAAIRGRPCGDPYRSQITSGRLVGLEWLSRGSPRDPALRRTRRRYAAILVVLSIVWIVLTSYAYGWAMGLHPAWCNPFGVPDTPGTCKMAFSIAAIEGEDVFLFGLMALGLLPALAVAAARFTRRAAQRCFCLALPDDLDWEQLESAGSEGFVAARRRVQARWLWLRWLASSLAAIVAVSLPVGYVWFMARHVRGVGEEDLFGLGLILGLAAVSFVPVRDRVCGLIDRARFRRARRRSKDAAVAEQLSELVALRNWLAASAPSHAEPLKALVVALRECSEVEPAEVERVCARLEEASARGPTLAPGHVEALTLEVEVCEDRLVA